MDGTVALNVGDLVENLKRQLTLFRDLVEVLNKERAALVSVKLKEIREVTFVKEALLSDLHREEGNRLRWMTMAQDALGIKERKIEMNDILGVISPAQVEAVNSARTALRYVVLQAKAQNTENQEFTESAIRESQVMKENALGMTGDRAFTYGPKGNMGRNHERNPRIVSREA